MYIHALFLGAVIHIGAGYVVILVVRVYQNLQTESDNSGLRLFMSICQ